ncbi:MAG: sulfite exporter TauE/SafE family protein [Pelolinea sp.]|nr:sulfite exporter TauE/SafE family protein [Pelolinea sp.]
MAKKTYFIQGMHCPACETFIERTVRKIKGIKKVDISLTKSRIVIEAESFQAIPSVYKLNQLLKENGYSFSEKIQKQPQRLSLINILQVVIIFLLVVVLFLTFNRSQLFSRFYVDASSNLTVFFFFGITAGLSSCAALVGGLLLSVQDSWVGKNSIRKKRGFLPFLLFNGSRLVTFAVLGGLLGALGGVFQFSLRASAVITILVSILMFIIGMQMLGVKLFQKIPLNYAGRMVSSVTAENKIKNNLMPIIFGAITFFIPCGYTLIVQTQALESGSFFRGLSILTAFALGTLPILLLISFSSVKFYKNPRFSSSFRFLSGLLILFFAVITINSQFGILNIPNLGSVKAQVPEVSLTTAEVDSQAAVPLEQDSVPQSQVMKMEVKGFEYFPKIITIKAGIPTRFEITDNVSIGCARAVYARGLYPEIILLQPGLNVVDFIAPTAGTYQISCSMWMVEPITVIVE